MVMIVIVMVVVLVVKPFRIQKRAQKKFVRHSIVVQPHHTAVETAPQKITRARSYAIVSTNSLLNLFTWCCAMLFFFLLYLYSIVGTVHCPLQTWSYIQINMKDPFTQCMYTRILYIPVYTFFFLFCLVLLYVFLMFLSVTDIIYHSMLMSRSWLYFLFTFLKCRNTALFSFFNDENEKRKAEAMAKFLQDVCFWTRFCSLRCAI